MIRIALAAAVLLAAVPVEAADTIPGPVACRVVSVYDGDTFTAECHPWPQIEVTVSVRVNGVDTPEIRGKCEAEKRQAKQARDYVRSITGNGVVLRIAFMCAGPAGFAVG